jgi:quinol monooxygenase YgiN
MGRRGDLVAEETTMATDDRCVTIQPYFEVKDGEMDDVRDYLERFVELTRSEPACLYYGFSICGIRVHCREGYTDAAGALAHLENVGPLLQEMLGTGKAELTDLQVHGPEQELAKMREPLAELGPSYWVLEYGFRN